MRTMPADEILERMLDLQTAALPLDQRETIEQATHLISSITNLVDQWNACEIHECDLADELCKTVTLYDRLPGASKKVPHANSRGLSCVSCGDVISRQCPTCQKSGV